MDLISGLKIAPLLSLLEFESGGLPQAVILRANRSKCV